MPLTIVAHIHALAEHTTFVKSELIKLIDTTRAEPGCINYDLHQDNDDPAHFMFFENWESRELWTDHMAAPHLSAYMNAVDGRIEKFTLYEMTPTD